MSTCLSLGETASTTPGTAVFGVPVKASFRVLNVINAWDEPK